MWQSRFRVGNVTWLREEWLREEWLTKSFYLIKPRRVRNRLLQTCPAAGVIAQAVVETVLAWRVVGSVRAVSLNNSVTVLTHNRHPSIGHLDKTTRSLAPKCSECDNHSWNSNCLNRWWDCDNPPGWYSIPEFRQSQSPKHRCNVAIPCSTAS